ncbi:PPPDE putative peptidase domain-containing protein [Calycina marina]|uniref:PPPDE putative peptidase domain-containing protein n=1 Tax=Calycina marina TaxID=1763456 RepID=A0A9P7Z0P8_9HELO|nr:PPPDE putative peptidase domain-containing protein [Calycina marina]
MEVQLYVYDLSNGLARNISAALVGIQIDAIYHTAIVFGGVEYTYDGGVNSLKPGASMGPPMEIIDLGETNLPMQIIMEYLDSLREIYTADAYDMFAHNCNNFSNDFATFLLGRGIPEYIVNLPDHVLNTPFGRMMKPQIDMFVKERQAKRDGGLIGVTRDSNNLKAPPKSSPVQKPKTQLAFERLLKEDKTTCSVVFFTSKNCKPCTALYPVFDELADSFSGKMTFILVDISTSFDIGSKHAIAATPTFITFLRGEQENRWSGADTNTLRLNVKMLLHMAFPQHAHESLRLPILRGVNIKPTIYSKVPPLAKLKAKLGSVAEDPGLSGLLHFIRDREEEGAAESTLPDLAQFSRFLHSAPKNLPPELMFVVVDVLRVAAADPRLSGYYAEETDHDTIVHLLTYVNSLKDCPYPLRLVTLHLLCNLFSSQLYWQHILCCQSLTEPMTQLVTTSLLDDTHPIVRVAAASLCFNIATSNSACRSEKGREALPEDSQLELVASLLEAVASEEQSAEAMRGYLLALGFLIYGSPGSGQVKDVLGSMDAQCTIMAKKKQFPEEPLIEEVGNQLIGN